MAEQPKTRGAKIKEARAEFIKDAQDGGSQRFILKNRTRASITLPKKSFDVPPKITIQQNETFIGDAYHMTQLGNMVMVVEQVEEQSAAPKAVDPNELVEQFDPETRRIRMVPRASLMPPSKEAVAAATGGKTSADPGEDVLGPGV